VRSLDHTPVAGFTATVGSSIVVGPSSRLSSAKAPTTLGEGRLLPQIEAATLPSLRVYSS
jgi:hypothetical protein